MSLIAIFYDFFHPIEIAFNTSYNYITHYDIDMHTFGVTIW